MNATLNNLFASQFGLCPTVCNRSGAKLAEQKKYSHSLGRWCLQILVMLVPAFVFAGKPARLNSSPTMFSKIDTRLFPLGGTGSSIIDANIAVFDNAFSNAIDPNDAFKMPNAGENFAIKTGNSILVIEARQAIVSRDTVNFEMWGMLSQSYTLEFDATFYNTPGLTAFLYDKYTGTNTPIDLNDTTRFNFTCDANINSKARDRFKLIFNVVSGGALPVYFEQVSATAQNQQVHVSWKVASEIDVLKYQVERSVDGRNFTVVQQQAALATSNGRYTYTWVDADLPGNVLFYRIKNIDLNGDARVSTTIRVSVNRKQQLLSVFPNPVHGNQVGVQLDQFAAGIYEAKIMDNSGRKVYHSTLQHNGLNSKYQFNFQQKMAPGLYHLQLITAAGAIQHTTILVN
jgi:hypothetical protein